MEIRRIGDTRDLLGESPVWLPEDEAFYWVDIRGEHIRRWKPVSDTVTSWPTPSLAGCIVPRRSGGLVVGLQDRIASFDPSSATFSHLFDLPELTSAQRLNDGKCDPQGRLWVGSMNIVTREPDGRLYRIDADGQIEIVLRGLAVPNSLSWNGRGDTLYFSQTRDRKVLAYPFEPLAGQIGQPRLLGNIEAPGTPDGATVDVSDHIWLAEYGNGRLSRFLPNGERAEHIELPCDYPTNCAFGGTDLTSLLITSASLPRGENSTDFPNDGGTFSMLTATPGRLADAFAG